MTAIFNITMAGFLFFTGFYHLWVGNLTDALVMFALILILHNAAGGYKAAQNSVIIYRVIAYMKQDVEAIKERTKFIRNHLLGKDQ